MSSDEGEEFRSEEDLKTWLLEKRKVNKKLLGDRASLLFHKEFITKTSLLNISIEYLETHAGKKGPLAQELYNKLKQQQQAVAIPSQWKEVPPLALSPNTNLFEREDAARALRDVLLTSKGVLSTPVLDQCFGAGKTSLVWQFRNILATTEGADEGGDTDRKRKLQDAIYLSVGFNDEDTKIAPSLSADDKEFK